jgi:hypothetical protein
MTVTSRSLILNPQIAADAVRRFFAAVLAGDQASVAAALHSTKQASAAGWASYGSSLKAAGCAGGVRILYHLGGIHGPSMDQMFGVVQASVGQSTYLVVTRAVSDTEDRVSDVLPLF